MRPRPPLIVLTALALLAGPSMAQSDRRARIFVERGCKDCHAVSALGIKALTDVDRDSIVGILRGAFEPRRADAETGVPTLPWVRTQ